MIRKIKTITATLGIVLIATSATQASGKRNNVVALASSYIGMHEKSNKRSLKVKLGVDPSKTPWCAAFVNAVLKQRGIKGTNNNHASSFLRWGKKTNTPRPGDIVVLANHVGIFVSFSKTRQGKVIKVLGGNQSNKVQISTFSVRMVRGFRTI